MKFEFSIILDTSSINEKFLVRIPMQIFKMLALILLIFVIWNCSKESDVIYPEDAALEGVWNEEYEWNSVWHVIGDPEEDSVMYKTTTINFGRNSFEIKIIPTHRILTQSGDSIFVTDSPDTLYTGRYTAKDDTLQFYISGIEKPEIFHYRINGDSLRIEQPSYKDSSGFIIIEMSSFLWSNTALKHSGVFARRK